MSLRSSSSQGIRSGCLHRNIKISRVDHTVSLKLDPYAIRSCTGENKIELNHWTSIGKEWMGVHQVDKVVARGGAEIWTLRGDSGRTGYSW